MHYGVVLHMISDVSWFLNGAGKTLVLALLGGFEGEERDRWRVVLEWAGGLVED